MRLIKNKLINFILFFEFIFLINICESEKYNDIYKIINIKYNSFLEKAVYLCIKSILKKNIENLNVVFDGIKKITEILNKNNMKNEYVFFKEINDKLEKVFLKKYKNKENKIIESSINFFKKIFHKYKKPDTRKNDLMDIIKDIILNDYIKFDIKNLNFLKITFLWVIYIYPKILKYNNFSDKEIEYILFYPIKKHYENLTFKTIGIENIIEKFFIKESETKSIKKQVLSECSNLFLDEEMALNIINKRYLFIKLLNDEKNKNITEKIIKIINDINKILKKIGEKSDLNKREVINYKKIENLIRNRADNDLFKRDNVLKKDKKGYQFLVKDFFSYYWYFLNIIQNCLGSFGGKNKDYEKNINTNIFEKNIFLKYFIPFSFFSFRKTFNLDFYKDSKNFNSILLNINTIGDLYAFNFYTRKSMFGEISLPVLSLIEIYYNFISNIYRIRRINESLFILNDINKYLTSIKTLVKKTNQALSLISEMYKNNNFTEKDFIPEVYYLKLFSKDNNKIIKELSAYNNIMSKTKLLFKVYFMPNCFAQFYFKFLNTKRLLKSLYNFIFTLDFYLTKIKLIKNNNNFCMPEIINYSEAKLTIEKGWYGNIKNDLLVYNDIYLGGENIRNAMIVAPTAAGKTVTLSTIISLLYLANSGIVSAKSMIYTYFYDIINNISNDYEIGSGISNNLSERKIVNTVIEIAKKNEQINRKAIILIDEMYRGTIPNLAVEKAFSDIGAIIKNKKSIFIFTTHLIPLVEKIIKSAFDIKLYYLKVDEINNTFINTYKLIEHDKNNWWLSDINKADRYQEYQEKTILN
jgi:hypothetical protein